MFNPAKLTPRVHQVLAQQYGMMDTTGYSFENVSAERIFQLWVNVAVRTASAKDIIEAIDCIRAAKENQVSDYSFEDSVQGVILTTLGNHKAGSSAPVLREACKRFATNYSEEEFNATLNDLVRESKVDVKGELFVLN